MTVEVAELDLGDEATLVRLVALQRASYTVEARLIGAPELPPMRETPEQERVVSGGVRWVRLDRSGAR